MQTPHFLQLSLIIHRYSRQFNSGENSEDVVFSPVEQIPHDLVTGMES